jgi:alkylation response protein AidB-like acyl-CoA dehydrogenase
MRAVFRHDPCLGLGYGASSLNAAVNVWAAGSAGQQQTVAKLLLGNRKLACAYHELAHGNDLARAEFEAAPHDGGLRLNGGKQVIANIARADAMIVYARTAPGGGSRNHSVLLVPKPEAPAEQVEYLPRFMTAGMRGVQLAGVTFRDYPVSADALVGNPGHGLETALKAFQLTRATLPAMFIGIVDTGLRTVLRYADGRRLYGRPVASLPQVRTVAAETFADLLLCDGFASVVARGIHFLPGEACATSSAVKYLLPKILLDAMGRLSTILGAEFYRRDGEFSIFQKLLRDLKPVGFGHAAAVTCQMTILPQLPAMARRSWLSGEGAPDGLFRLGGELPPLAFERLALSSGGQDHLSGSLAACHAWLAGADAAPDPELLGLAEIFLAELGELKRQSAALAPEELTAMASPESYALAARYALVLAASACLNLWRVNPDSADPLLRDPVWIVAVLTRLAARLGKRPALLPESVSERLAEHLQRRYRHALSFDLSQTPLPGWH